MVRMIYSHTFIVKKTYDCRFFFQMKRCDRMICEMSEKLRAILKEV